MDAILEDDELTSSCIVQELGSGVIIDNLYGGITASLLISDTEYGDVPEEPPPKTVITTKDGKPITTKEGTVITRKNT